MSAKRVLAIYNSYEGELADGRHCCRAIHGVVSQKCAAEIDIVVSDVCSSSDLRRQLVGQFEGKVAFHFIDARLPLGVTCNYTAQAMSARHAYDYYAVVDMGTLMADSADGGDYLDVFHALLQEQRSADSVAVSVVVPHHSPVPPGKHVPAGVAVPMACAMFSAAWYGFYGNKLLADVFVNARAAKDVYPLAAAAIGKKCKTSTHSPLWRDLALSDDRRFQLPWDHPPSEPLMFASPKTMATICEEGRKLGFGYDHVRAYDVAKFSQGFAAESELKHFVRKNLFSAELDYSRIPSFFIECSKGASKAYEDCYMEALFPFRAS